MTAVDGAAGDVETWGLAVTATLNQHLMIGAIAVPARTRLVGHGG